MPVIAEYADPCTLNLDRLADELVARKVPSVPLAKAGDKGAHLDLAGKLYGAYAGMTSFAQAQDAITRALARHTAADKAERDSWRIR